jgi:alkylated DNA repair dioxygenase AlkB
MHDSCSAATLEKLPLDDAELGFAHAFLSAAEADHAFSQLLADMPWRHDQITVYGKQHWQPRLTAWIGDEGSHYTYSGLALAPQPWTPLLLELKQRIESVAATRFNSVLLNLYRDGNDSVGWHSDDESELGPEPVIASLSLGQSRTFHLKHKRRKELPPLKIELAHGCLLVMGGATQRNYVHAVPKSAKALGPRINLTFRTIAG